MAGLSAAALGLAGLLVGAAIGFATRRARLCTLGALEAALMGGDWRRMKIFGLALAIALAGAQALIVAGLLDEAQTTYLPPRIALLSTLIGSLLFGLGMSLVGTCAFGSLVRLGGGDMRSLVVMIVYGLVALATLRGPISGLRIGWLESFALPMPAPLPGSLSNVAAAFLPFEPRAWIAGSLVLLLLGAAASDKRLRKSPRLLAAGVVLGLGVLAGWVATGVMVDEFSTVRAQSLTFVAPVARALHVLLLGAGEWLDFGVMTLPGVVIGSFLAARAAQDFRWEAFDDHHEMRRHLAGALLMGFGGVLAGGCTIGQGLTAGSLLAVTWPVAVLGMMAGAWIGLTLLVEGSVREAIAIRYERWRGARRQNPAE